MAASFSDARILVVDDDEINCNLLQARLRFFGFKNIIAAMSGTEALQQVAAQMPDLILLDVMMPDMDGFEVTQQIRESYPTAFIPIILVSALQEPHDRTRGIQAGANDFVSKPFDPDELLARINSLLALKQARDELDMERQRLALLYDVGQALMSKLDCQHLMREVVSLTSELTSATKALLVILGKDGSFQQKILSRRGSEPRSTDTIDPRVLTQGLLGWMIEHRQPVLVPDVSQDERWVQLSEDDTPVVSAAGVPLVRGGQVAGGLLLTSPYPDAFKAEHLNLLTAIASQAAITLENVQLYEEARQQRARSEALFNQTADPVIVTNAEGIITSINPAAERILHLSEGDLNRPLAEVFSLTLADLFLRAQERGSAVLGEYTYRDRATGGQRIFNVSISPIEGVGYLLVWQDITDLKENERFRLNIERAETQRVLEAFSRYMSPALLDKVLNDRAILKRRERREAIVLFADLRGFTRLTVEHPPDIVVELLNDVFTEMIDIVYKYEGVIFDIVGDELMVGFNVPYNQLDAPRRALSTAIEIQRRFIGAKERWAARGMQIGLGIGMNRGLVVLGHVGGHSRMDYAMVGLTVNIAHRLVEIAQDGQIIVTPEVLAEGLPTDAVDLKVEKLPPQIVKGKDEPQEMFLLELTNAVLHSHTA